MLVKKSVDIFSILITFEKLKNKFMSTTITLKGNEIHTIGTLPAVGTTIRDFALVDSGLNVKTLESFEGKKKYSIFFLQLIQEFVRLLQENLMKKLQIWKIRL
jgi:hypothetical protein